MNQTAHERPREHPYLTQVELARRWSVSARTLEKWRSLGLGPAYIKIGGRVRYRLADVTAYEDNQVRGGR